MPSRSYPSVLWGIPEDSTWVDAVEVTAKGPWWLPLQRGAARVGRAARSAPQFFRGRPAGGDYYGLVAPPPPSAAELEQLRQRQANIQAQGAAALNMLPQGGGFYGDFGLGLGGGFNLHFDRYGITPSVGAGAFGRATVGYAVDDEALRATQQQNRIFGSASLGKGFGANAEYNYGSGELSGGLGPGQVVIGPDGSVRPGLQGDVGRYRGAPTVSADGKAYSFGFDGGIGWLHQLPTDPYGPDR